MSSVEKTIPSSLIFSEAAASKVKELIEEEGNEALKLRVFISGGGCMGLPLMKKSLKVTLSLKMKV